MQILPGQGLQLATDTSMFCMCTPPLQTIGVSVLATLATVIKRGIKPDSLSDQRFAAKPRYCVSVETRMVQDRPCPVATLTESTVLLLWQV